MAEYNIRPAARNDSATILSFIKKLAEYEKKLDQVTASTADIEKYLFDHKIAEAIIAEHEGEPAGFAIFFHNFSTFMGKPGIYIEDLFVDKKKRGKSLGLGLFSYIASLALERGCGFLEWSVLKWNKPSIDFYKKMGAYDKKEWDLYRLSGQPLKKLAEYNK
jgi:GNAT superfamily N-acetyltransferase